MFVIILRGAKYDFLWEISANNARLNDHNTYDR